MTPGRCGQVLAPDNAHKSFLRRQTSKRVPQTSRGAHVGFVGGKNAWVTVFVKGFT